MPTKTALDDLLEEAKDRMGPIFSDRTIPRHIYGRLLDRLITDLQVRRRDVAREQATVQEPS